MDTRRPPPRQPHPSFPEFLGGGLSLIWNDAPSFTAVLWVLLPYGASLLCFPPSSHLNLPSLRCYEELSAVCSEEDNYSQSRRLLFQVTSLDKIPAVIAKALEKHNQERSQAPQYKLVQLLSEGQELAFPPTTNVFYAMNSSCQDFMLRAKQGKPAPLPPLPRTPTPKGVEISATFPKIKATGRKIAKALF
ncbi:ral guanine nucleotide dissociation stimulator-like 2 isoform X1 [Pogona vitticeps]